MAALPTRDEVAGMIDHALLGPNMTYQQLREGLELAARLQLFSVCVQPSNVSVAIAVLEGSGVKVGTVIGFPHGVTTSAVKAAEAIEAVRDGANEVDMVLQIGAMVSGDKYFVLKDIQRVVSAVPGTLVKVILETAYLSDKQVVTASSLVERTGAQFVKTSTGFAGGGATVNHLRLMRRGAPSKELKASGGVRDLTAFLEMKEAGATRIGTSASEVILQQLASMEGANVPAERDHSGGY